MRPPWWFVGRWQAFVAGLLMACSFLAVWLGLTYSYTLTNFTVHEPGAEVVVDGVTYKYLGMVRTQVGTGSPDLNHAPPGTTYVALVMEVTIPSDGGGYCSFGLTDTTQSLVWWLDQSSVIGSEFRQNCFEIPPDTPSPVVSVFEVPTSQAENIGGVVIHPSTWRSIAEVVR